MKLKKEDADADAESNLNRSTSRRLYISLLDYITIVMFAPCRLSRLERRRVSSYFVSSFLKRKAWLGEVGCGLGPSEFRSPKFGAELMTIDDRRVVGVSDARPEACTTTH
jgi:hypothetical protein